MREGAQTAAEDVVFAVVEGEEVVAATHAGFAVRGVLGGVAEEVVVAQEAGFMVAEFAHHDGVG